MLVVVAVVRAHFPMKRNLQEEAGAVEEDRRHSQVVVAAAEVVRYCFCVPACLRVEAVAVAAGLGAE